MIQLCQRKGSSSPHLDRHNDGSIGASDGHCRCQIREGERHFGLSSDTLCYAVDSIQCEQENNVPRFEKLSPEEAQQLGRRRQSVLDLSEYHGFLAQLEPGGSDP